MYINYHASKLQFFSFPFTICSGNYGAVKKWPFQNRCMFLSPFDLVSGLRSEAYLWQQPRTMRRKSMDPWSVPGFFKPWINGGGIFAAGSCLPFLIGIDSRWLLVAGSMYGFVGKAAHKKSRAKISRSWNGQENCSLPSICNLWDIGKMLSTFICQRGSCLENMLATWYQYHTFEAAVFGVRAMKYQYHDQESLQAFYFCPVFKVFAVRCLTWWYMMYAYCNICWCMILSIFWESWRSKFVACC